MTNFNSHGADLDGKSKIAPTPYDAHEKATRGEHVPTTKTSPDKTSVAEYPKAIDHVQKDGAPKGHLEPVIVKSAEEERAYKASKAKSAPSE
jgi:hypothetical protein